MLFVIETIVKKNGTKEELVLKKDKEHEPIAIHSSLHPETDSETHQELDTDVSMEKEKETVEQEHDNGGGKTGSRSHFPFLRRYDENGQY